MATRVLVTYASKHGSTQEMAERIAFRLNQLGIHADARPMNKVDELGGYDGVVVGSSVYFGRWMKAATEFVERVRPALAGSRVWLFSSGPLGDQTGTDSPEIAVQAASLHVVEHHMFAGALRKERLSLVERALVKGVKAINKSPSISPLCAPPYGDFRNWTEIDAWAASIARELEHSAFSEPQSRAIGN